MSAGILLRQLSAVVVGAVLLGGCGSLSQNFGYQGVGIPTPAQITAFYKETEDGTVVAGTGRRIAVGEYLLASLTYTNEKCHLFFEALEAFRQDSSFIDHVLTAAVASGSPLLALSGSATSKSVARITSAVALANLANKYTADVYAFASYRESLKTHVFDALADFQSKKGLDILSKARYGIYAYQMESDGFVYVTIDNQRLKVDKKRATAFFGSFAVIDMMIARTIASDYAALCSLANMRRIVTESLNATTTKARTNGSPSAPATTITEAKE